MPSEVVSPGSDRKRFGIQGDTTGPSRIRDQSRRTDCATTSVMISAQGVPHAFGSSVAWFENAALPYSNRGVGPAHWQPSQCTGGVAIHAGRNLRCRRRRDLDDIRRGCSEELCEGVLCSRNLPLSV